MNHSASDITMPAPEHTKDAILPYFDILDANSSRVASPFLKTKPPIQVITRKKMGYCLRKQKQNQKIRERENNDLKA